MPFIKFMVRNPLDIERLLRIIDDDNLDAKGKANYDELDEEDVVLVIEKGDDPNLPQGLIIPSPSLPLEGDEDIINTAAEDLRELLADGPIVKGSNPISAMERITNEGDSGRGTWV